MLPAPARLRRPADFTTTVRRGRRTARGALVLSLLAGNPDSQTLPLVGFAVSRAVGGSVVRHRVTRQLRHLMRDRLERLPRGSRLVIRALPPVVDRSTTSLERDLDAALSRLLVSAPRPARTGRGER